MTMFYAASTGGFYNTAIHGTDIPSDSVEISPEEYEALMTGQTDGKQIVPGEGGLPTLQNPPPPTAEQIQAMFVAAIQEHLDDFARTRGYDGILSACTYATSGVPKFAAEGQAAVNLRDAAWAAAYAILAAVQDGQRQMPTIEDVLAELPVLGWPE